MSTHVMTCTERFLMTIEDAEAALASTAGKAIIGALAVGLVTAFFALAGWTLSAVERNGSAEDRLELKFDALTNAVTAFQSQAAAQRALDETQTAAISAVRSDVLRLEQAFKDHVRSDEVLVKAPGGH